MRCSRAFLFILTLIAVLWFPVLLSAQSANYRAQAKYYSAKEQFTNKNYEQALAYLDDSRKLLNGNSNELIQYLYVLSAYNAGHYVLAQKEVSRFFDLVEDRVKPANFSKDVEHVSGDEIKDITKLMDKIDQEVANKTEEKKIQAQQEVQLRQDEEKKQALAEQQKKQAQRAELLPKIFAQKQKLERLLSESREIEISSQVGGPQGDFIETQYLTDWSWQEKEGIPVVLTMSYYTVEYRKARGFGNSGKKTRVEKPQLVLDFSAGNMRYSQAEIIDGNRHSFYGYNTTLADMVAAYQRLIALYYS